MTKIWTTLLNERLGMRGTLCLSTLIVLVALLGAAHILVRTSTYGAVLNSDAFNYLSAAESLAAGEGLLSPGGGQMVLFAPFLSMALAFLSLFGIEPVDGGRFLNATAFGLLILASGLWLSRRLEARPIALGVAVAVMASLPRLMLCILPCDGCRLVMPYVRADTSAFAISKQSSTIGSTNL